MSYHIPQKDLSIQFNRKPCFLGIDNLITVDGINFYDSDSTKGKDLYKKSYVVVKRNLIRELELPAKELYETFCKHAAELYEASNQKYDMMKTGCISNTALFHFLTSDKVKNLNKVHVTFEESEIMEETSKSDIIYTREYVGDLFKYDVKSLYPYLLISNKFPIKPGRFEKIEELSKDLAYGFYRCKLVSSHWSFNHNQKNEWVTHIDINSSLALKKKVKLICDDSPNAYVYDPDCLYDGKEIFGDFVESFYKLKEVDKCFFAKPVLNALWGSLCQKTAKVIVIPFDDFDEHNENWQITKTVYMGDKIKITKIPKNKGVYRFEFARMMPFLKSMSCAYMRSIFWKQKDQVVFLHTDGFILNEYCKGTFTAKTKLGQLRYEGRCTNGYVNNIMDRTKNTEFTYPGAGVKKVKKKQDHKV